MAGVRKQQELSLTRIHAHCALLTVLNKGHYLRCMLREAGDTSTIRISTRGILEWMVFISRSQARLHFLGIWPDTSTGIDGPMCKRSGQPNSQLMLRQLLGGASHQECSRISTKISAEPG